MSEQLHGNGDADDELPSSSRFLITPAPKVLDKQKVKMHPSTKPKTISFAENTAFKKPTKVVTPKNSEGLLQRLPSAEDLNARFRGRSDDNLTEILKHYGIDENEQLQPSQNSKFRTITPTLPAEEAPRNIDHNEHNERLTSFGVSLADTFSDVILSHPCLVLRRQAQVNNVGRTYHFTPFTIITAAWRLQKVQGLSCLWKGVGSGLICNGMTFGIESIISETNPNFPQEVSTHSTLKQMAGHLALKAFSATIILPFYSAHLVESIQSDIASDKPGIFFCLTEGFSRLFGYGGVQSQRLLPFRKLLIPTVSYILIKYTMTAILRHLILLIIRTYKKWKHEQILKRLIPKSPATPSSTSQYDFLTPTQMELQQQLEETYLKSNFPELFAKYLAQLITDICLYPLETVVYRIHIQGTRSIIDDMNTSSGFLPVSTRYTGAADCFATIHATEGVLGFYRGFGALVLQQGLKFGVLKILEVILELTSSS